MRRSLPNAITCAALVLGAVATAARAGTPEPPPLRVIVTTDSARATVERMLRVEASRLATTAGALALHVVTLECDRAMLAAAASAAAAAEAPNAPNAPSAPHVQPAPAPVPRVRVPRVVRVLRTGRAPEASPVDMQVTVTDTVFRITRPGATLSLETLLGDVNVTGWGRNVIRVRAEHDPRMRVTAEWRGRDLVLDAESPIGPSNVDWNVWVPATMPVAVSAIEGDITVNGTNASVEAQSVKGDVHVSGGNGVLDVNSVEGEVHVSGARGTVRAGSINNGVRLIRLIGEIDAQTVNGDIQLSELDAERVDASTVNGSVWYGGRFRDNGQYRLSSHNGTLVVGVPEDAGLDLTVQSFNGAFQPALPMRLPVVPKGKRFEFQLGGGGASLDLESFNGFIRLVRADDLARLRERVRSRESAPTPPARERGEKGKEGNR